MKNSQEKIDKEDLLGGALHLDQKTSISSDLTGGLNPGINQMLTNFHKHWDLKGKYRDQIVKEMDVLVGEGEKSPLSGINKKKVFALVIFATQKKNGRDVLQGSSNHRLLENPKKWAKILLNEDDYVKYELIAKKYTGDASLENEGLEHLYRALYALMFDKESYGQYETLYGTDALSELGRSIQEK